MKKVLACLFILATLLAITACGKTATEAEEQNREITLTTPSIQGYWEGISTIFSYTIEFNEDGTFCENYIGEEKTGSYVMGDTLLTLVYDSGTRDGGMGYIYEYIIDGDSMRLKGFCNMTNDDGYLDLIR